MLFWLLLVSEWDPIVSFSCYHKSYNYSYRKYILVQYSFSVQCYSILNIKIYKIFMSIKEDDLGNTIYVDQSQHTEKVCKNEEHSIYGATKPFPFDNKCVHTKRYALRGT